VKLTRRSALGTLGAGILFAQTDKPGSFKIGWRGESQGTRLRIFDAGIAGQWVIALTSNEQADHASVDVFYEVRSSLGKLLLSKNSFCPVVGGGDYAAATDQNFSVPLEDVRFIRVKLLKEVAQREFR
jgi:hypothetical protein